MAIQKIKSFNSGVDGNYWKVIGVSIECMPQTLMRLQVQIGCYLSKAERNANKAVIAVESFEFEIPKDAMRNLNDPMECAYIQLKTLDFFSDGLDI